MIIINMMCYTIYIFEKMDRLQETHPSVYEKVMRGLFVLLGWDIH